MSLRSSFLEFDDALARKGVPPLTSWWRDGIGSWLDSYGAGGALELVACVGRGAAKSTALYKLATFFTLFGDAAVPPGERHYAIVLSRLKDEANKGIAIIGQWLRLLGVAHRLAGDVIDLIDLPRGIRVVAASVAATSGWRAFFVGKDERSKWPTGGVEENEAEEIDTSAGAMTATHRRAPTVTVGSAWRDAGAFFDAVRAGSNAHRVVLGPAATWVAAPHIREADLRAKERNVSRFAREYLCEFQSGGLFFDPDLVARVDQRAFGDFEPAGDAIIVVDSSAGRGDAFTWAAFQFRRPVLEPSAFYVWVPPGSPGAEKLVTFATGVEGPVSRLLDANGEPVVNPEAIRASRPVLCMFRARALAGRFGQRVDFDSVMNAIASDAIAVGAAHVVGDQFNEFPIRGALARFGLAYHAIAYTAANKPDAVAAVSRWLSAGTLAIEPGEEANAWKREALAFQETLAPSGALTFGARRGAHDDRIALTITAALAEKEGLLHGSPYRRVVHRTEIHDYDDDVDTDD